MTNDSKKRWGRAMGAIVAGMVAAGVVITVLERAFAAMHPFPATTSPEDATALAAYVAALPAGALAQLLVAHALAAVVGAGAATLVARRAPVVPALVVAVLLATGALANALAIPHPTWFAILDVAMYPPLAWLVVRTSARRTPAT